MSEPHSIHPMAGWPICAVCNILAMDNQQQTACSGLQSHLTLTCAVSNYHLLDRQVERSIVGSKWQFSSKKRKPFVSLHQITFPPVFRFCFPEWRQLLKYNLRSVSLQHDTSSHEKDYVKAKHFKTDFQGPPAQGSFLLSVVTLNVSAFLKAVCDMK